MINYNEKERQILLNKLFITHGFNSMTYNEKEETKKTLFNNLSIKHGFNFDANLIFQEYQLYKNTSIYFKNEKPTIFIKRSIIPKSFNCKYIFKNKYKDNYNFYNPAFIKTNNIPISSINKIIIVMDNLLEKYNFSYNFNFKNEKILNFGFLNKFIYDNYIINTYIKKNPTDIHFELSFIIKEHYDFIFKICDEFDYIQNLKYIIKKIIEINEINMKSIDMKFLLNFETIDELVYNSIIYKMTRY